MSRAVLVTGMAGAGRTTCLKTLEDLGFEAVDNVPVGLVARLLHADEGGGEPPPDIAVGIDSRTRGFVPERVLQDVAGARKRWAGDGGFRLLFLECDDEVLQRRFSASRRRHPLAEHGLSIGDALARERVLLAPLKSAADLVIDTSDLALPDLRRLLLGHFGGGAGRLQLAVVSFSFKRGLPRDADLVFDVRFLSNPYYVEGLRALTGRDAAVQEHVRSDPDFAPFMARLRDFLAPLLPRYRAEGKSYLTAAFGCTGGQHRSVYVGELVAEWLRREGWEVALRHRDMHQSAAAAVAEAVAAASTPTTGEGR